MECITNEIRSKIKSAVKAKLQEIGAYSDEELPDYIMVMISNKRSSFQMKNELSLFLGGHTDKFTDWLHAVLEKLEAYTASNNSSEISKESSAIPKQEMGVTLNPSSSIISPQSSFRLTSLEQSQDNTRISHIETNKQPELTKGIQLNATSTMDHSEYVPMPVTGSGVSILLKNTSLPEEVDDDCLNIREENADQEYHPDDTSSRKRNTSRSIYKASSSSGVKKRVYSSRGEDRSGKRVRREESSRSRKEESRVSSRIGSVVRPTVLSQVVKPVNRDNRHREERDKYMDEASDNKNGVNSIVRVTNRRKLPTRIQATKSLILKAVADAQKSVASQPLKVVEPESKPPGLFTRRYREKIMNREKVAITIKNSSGIPQAPEESSMDVDAEQYVEKDENIDQIIDNNNQPIDEPGVENRVIQTRFIVTLEGAQSFMSQRFEDDDDDAQNNEDTVEMTEPKETERKPVKSRLYRRRSTGSEAEAQQSLERCKFWPSCRQGDRCTFHHPKMPCKTFPNCSFGDGCLFVHPHCKFDLACTRRGCPYSHSSRPKTGVSTAPVVVPVKAHPPPVVHGKTVCKFFPMCNNVSCAFFHPPACKFGANCTRNGCTFHHPSAIPTTNKLKWVTSMK